MTAPSPHKNERWLELEIAAGECERQTFRSSDEREFRLQLSPKSTGSYRIALRVSELLPGGLLSDDLRYLGLYLKLLAVDVAGK